MLSVEEGISIEVIFAPNPNFEKDFDSFSSFFLQRGSSVWGASVSSSELSIVCF